MLASLRKLGLGTEKYPALTGVRAVGASVVFFDHFPPSLGVHVVINVLAFFFALSGFLIVRIYYEQARISVRWLTKYFVNRFARIYPVYFLLLTAAVLLNHASGWWTLLTNYTLTHALFHGTTVIIQASWSLTVEECFYFLAPAFMLLARRYTFLAPFALGCLLLAAALAVSQLGYAFLGTRAFVLSTTFFGHFAEFFAGVWLALHVIKLEKQGSIRTRGCVRTVVGVLGVSALIGAMMLVYQHPPLDSRRIIVINNFLMPLPIALLYSGFIREETVLARLLSGQLAGLLGRSSYSFYLMHGVIIDWVSAHLAPGAADRLLWITVTFGITWLLSVLLFVFYEEPLNLLIRGKFRSNEKSVGMADTLFRPHAGIASED
jgi:peptidoglycan/LPS O-acetylase OafA/YrhL